MWTYSVLFCQWIVFEYCKRGTIPENIATVRCRLLLSFVQANTTITTSWRWTITSIPCCPSILLTCICNMHMFISPPIWSIWGTNIFFGINKGLSAQDIIGVGCGTARVSQPHEKKKCHYSKEIGLGSFSLLHAPSHCKLHISSTKEEERRENGGYQAIVWGRGG